MSKKECDSDFVLSLKDVKELNEAMMILQMNLEKIGKDDSLFFNTNDVREITGWSKKTVEDLFNHPAFPCSDIGKRKLVLKFAFVKFFMERRCRDNEDYWRYNP